MIKILSIGNSYATDATRYVYGITRADGVAMKVVNLYIGGCSLARHYRNMLGDAAAYDFEINGITATGVKLSIKDALLSDDWDFVTLQQASRDSTDYETYQPYLDSIAAYVRKHAPKAKLLIHQTWGYREGTPRLEKLKVATHAEMFEGAKKAYFLAAERICADGILPSGEAICLAMREKTEHMLLHRDEIHLSLGLGRYIAGLVWYGTLTKRPIAENTFRDFDEGVSEESVAFAKRIAEQVITDYSKFQK